MLPKIEKIEQITVLQPTVSATSTGVKIYSVSTNGGDVVRFSLVFCAGVKYQSAPFVASACANLLSEGCGDYSAKEVAEFLDFYGIYYDISIDRDYTIITICSLVKFTDKTLSILEKILLAPHLLQSECEVYAAKQKETLKIAKEKLSSRSREAFVKSLFGSDHDYGRFANPDDYDTLSADMLRDHYNRFYVRENLFISISGDHTQEDIDKLSTIVDQLPKGESARRVTLEPNTPSETIKVENASSVQSSINIGRRLFSRNHPDFIAMQVTSTLLGGYFSSRLMQNIREDKGYTYGVHAATINLQDGGYFAISTEVIKEHADSAVEQIFYEIDRLKNEPVPEEELEMVKRVITGEMLRILDGPFGICDVTIENIQNGKSNQYTQKMIEMIDAVTTEDIATIANRYLCKEDLTTVIYY